jgi:hypothetical protein
MERSASYRVPRAVAHATTSADWAGAENNLWLLIELDMAEPGGTIEETEPARKSILRKSGSSVISGP